ncbi:MAG TPA: bis(5'-nucleosyl)-tetraphosphatase [Candidatus Babeliales bacterium]|nr:bis(5'-nucleosyl)-tetraphosphatase [Candidatus Babeliales bacterium]
MNREFSAGVVVYYERVGKRTYLLLHYASGHWDFPKGHIENGENKVEAAIRELQEETGLSAKLVDGFEESFEYFFKNSKTHELILKTVYFFIGKVSTKKVMLSHEHVGYEWLPYKEAIEKLTYPNAKELLKNMERFLNDRDEKK